MTNVLQFRNPHQPRITRKPIRAPQKVPYPTRLNMVCHDGEVSVDPESKRVEEVFPHTLPNAGEPVVYFTDGIVLDLGDCTPTRTLLRLDPGAARAWGQALISMADFAEQQGDRDGDEDSGGATDR